MISKVEIVNLLKTNDRAVVRALVVLNERQTNDEQSSEHTKYQNGRGFRPCHARMGTSMAKFYQKFKRLSDKQIAYWRMPMRDGKMRIEIYAGQLLEVAQLKEREKQVPKQAGVYKPYAPEDSKWTKVMDDEREMQRMEAEGDREETRRDELNKFIAKCRMENA